MVAYGLGATDKFKGTGVWSGVEFQRERKEEKETKELPPATETTTSREATKKVKETVGESK